MRKNFTLIELLIVIAIIAILAGMLLPALNRARESARTINCGSQIRQVAHLHLLYAGDYKDLLPSPWKSYGGNASVQEWYYQSYLASNYLGNKWNRNLLLCPTLLPAKLKALNGASWVGTLYGSNSVAIEGISSGWFEIEKNRPLSRIPFASRGCLMLENYGHGIFDCRTTSLGNLATGNANPAFNHSGQANGVFFDGHLEKLKRRQVPCYESYPSAGVANRGNTYFVRGDTPLNPTNPTYTIVGL
ncbi:MAG: hypothetical protein BWY31_03196 [Lentisphaerae bacterium ADurb.Bin242]|nr:MAG: hypothetical protein BWY31_03196 [Lentisphaerae bacterium ADurb.Bin242]